MTDALRVVLAADGSDGALSGLLQMSNRPVIVVPSGA